MKTFRTAFTLLFLGVCVSSFAQAKREPIVINVPFDKRITLIFPAKIVDNVLGHESVDPVVNNNKYYITATNSKGFPETSLYIELESGHFYDFKLRYNNTVNTAVVVFSTDDATGNIKKLTIKQEDEEEEEEPAAPTKTVEKTVAYKGVAAPKASKTAKPVVEHDSVKYRRNALQILGLSSHLNDIAVADRKLTFSLGSVYIVDDKLYLKVKVKNESRINYDIFQLAFNIVPKKAILSKDVADPEILEPIFVLNKEINTVMGKGVLERVYVFDKFTVSDKKKVLVSIWEKGGDREVNFSVSGNTLLKAKTL